VERQLLNRVSIPRISSPADRISCIMLKWTAQHTWTQKWLQRDKNKLCGPCMIWGFHSGDYEEWCLLGCYAVWLL
jgi:hypothetical protein